MADFKPLIYSIAFIMIIGLFVPFIIGFFIDVSDVPQSNLLNSTINIINDGIEVDVLGLTSFDINPFSLLGDTLISYITEALTFLSIFPDFLIKIIIVLITISLAYSIFSLIRG